MQGGGRTDKLQEVRGVSELQLKVEKMSEITLPGHVDW